MRVGGTSASVLILMAHLAFATEPHLADIGHPLQNDQLTVQWGLVSGSLPVHVNVYSVSSTKWSTVFLSNLVALLDFRNAGKALTAIEPALKGEDAWYSDEALRGSRKNLILNPSKGRIFFNSEGIVALPRQPIVGVPTEQEVLRRLLELLPKLGIPKDELRRKPNSEELFTLRDVTTHGRRDPQTGSVAKQVIARGVFLFRRVDGIPLAGRGTGGGLHVNFGNGGRIAELELVWRNVHSPGRVSAADTNQIARWIRQGKATIETEENPVAISRLFVTNATIFYFANSATEHQRRMYPFVSLDAVADIDRRKIGVSINCPIVDD